MKLKFITLFETKEIFNFWFHPLLSEEVKGFILKNASKVTSSCTSPDSCVRASESWFAFLTSTLKDHWIELKEGFYYPNGEVDDEDGDFAGVGHTWIEIDGLIFDPTADQFDDFPKIDEENYEEAS